MTAEQHLKEEIKTRIEYIPAERLSDVLDFIIHIEEDSEETGIMIYAGILSDVEEEIMNNLTIHLHKNRLSQSRRVGWI